MLSPVQEYFFRRMDVHPVTSGDTLYSFVSRLTLQTFRHRDLSWRRWSQAQQWRSRPTRGSASKQNLLTTHTMCLASLTFMQRDSGLRRCSSKKQSDTGSTETLFSVDHASTAFSAAD